MMLVSMTWACSRISASSSRSCSIASTSALCVSEAMARDSGCMRRVSENRRTSVSVLASRKIDLIAMP